jgi:hypothetical protein
VGVRPRGGLQLLDFTDLFAFRASADRFCDFRGIHAASRPVVKPGGFRRVSGCAPK